MKSVLMAFFLTALALSTAVFAQTVDESAIDEAYDNWVTATNAKDIERWSAFLAPEVLFLPPDHVPLSTHEAIRQYYLQTFADPHFSLHCEQRSVEIAASGEIAWSTGGCEATFSDSNGEMARGKSKWAKVWAKQADGSWKCQLNIWNNDPS